MFCVFTLQDNVTIQSAFYFFLQSAPCNITIESVVIPLVDMFRTFYFDEIIDSEDKLEIIKSNFVFT